MKSMQIASMGFVYSERIQYRCMNTLCSYETVVFVEPVITRFIRWAGRQKDRLMGIIPPVTIGVKPARKDTL